MNSGTNHTDAPEKETRRRLAKLSLAALGVVFGDIGTSPLYAIRECFHGDYGIAGHPGERTGRPLPDVLGPGADRHPQIPDLYPAGGQPRRRRGHRADRAAQAGMSKFRIAIGRGLAVVGLFAACLLYGDGMITPAISVLSAVEGIRIITPVFKPYVVPLTIAILAGLFLIQQHGTARVGSLFGPIILVWFALLAVLGPSRSFARQVFCSPSRPGMASSSSLKTGCTDLSFWGPSFWW